jgi:hypothetical protein
VIGLFSHVALNKPITSGHTLKRCLWILNSHPFKKIFIRLPIFQNIHKRWLVNQKDFYVSTNTEIYEIGWKWCKMYVCNYIMWIQLLICVYIYIMWIQGWQQSPPSQLWCCQPCGDGVFVRCAYSGLCVNFLTLCSDVYCINGVNFLTFCGNGS